MRPADLPLGRWPVVVDGPAVAAQEAVNGVAQQPRQSREIPPDANDEDGDVCRRGDPQPAFASALLPTGLVDVFDGGFFDCLQRLGVGGFQGRADFLLQGRDRAKSHRGSEHVLTDLLDGAFGELVATGQVGEGGSQPRPTAMGPDVGGDGRSSNLSAAGTSPCVSLILRDLGDERGQFRDLMPGGRWVICRGLGRQRGLALAAVGGHEVNDIFDAFGRQ